MCIDFASYDLAEQIVKAEGVDLIIPWPYGLDLQWAKQHEFVIEHMQSAGNTEVFSTLDGTGKLTEAGLLCHVNTFSPFVMRYGTAQEMQHILDGHAGVSSGLPQTGDDSSLALWFAMLCLAGVSVVLLRRRSYN